MPSLTQLSYIVAVAEERHFAKAAKKCHVSQPSLSMQIQKAEDELGILLFDRSKKPIELTDRGLIIVRQAKLILFEESKLKELAKKSMTKVSGTYRLGIIPTLASYVLPLFVPEFSSKYPEVNLFIDEMKTPDIIKSLSEDTLDGALLATPLYETKIVEKPVFYESFILYLHPKHLLASKNKVNQSDLIPHGIWLLKEGHCLRNQVLSFCNTNKNEGLFPNIEFYGGSLETLVSLIKKCGGYTLLPELMARSVPEKVNLKRFSAPVPAREISLVHRKGHWKEEITSVLFQLLKDSLPGYIAKEKNPSLTIVSI